VAADPRPDANTHRARAGVQSCGLPARLLARHNGKPVDPLEYLPRR
jgi:hypothetical protein